MQDENTPVTSNKLDTLMNHVDESFPDLEHESEIPNLAVYKQYFWARSQEWNHCLEELCVIMFAEIPNSKHMYYIGREFKG